MMSSIRTSSIVTAAFAIIAAAVLPASGTVFLDDGGSHIINTPSDNVVIFDGPGGATTNAVFLPGADLGEGLFDDSLFLLESSTAQIFGGNFQQDVVADDGSVLTITGGTMQDDLLGFGASTIIMTGGSLADDVETDDVAIVQLFGGSFGMDIEASGFSIIHIFGGQLGVSGIFDTGFGVEDAATIHLYGLSFLIDGAPTGPGAISQSSGILAGILGDGNSFSMPFERFDDGAIVLHVVPEPASAMLLLLGAATVLSRRRQRIAA